MEAEIDRVESALLAGNTRSLSGIVQLAAILLNPKAAINDDSAKRAKYVRKGAMTKAAGVIAWVPDSTA